MNAIITVVGSDKVGIIAKVSNFLCEHKIQKLFESIQQTFSKYLQYFRCYVSSR